MHTCILDNEGSECLVAPHLPLAHCGYQPGHIGLEDCKALSELLATSKFIIVVCDVVRFSDLWPVVVQDSPKLHVLPPSMHSGTMQPFSSKRSPPLRGSSSTHHGEHQKEDTQITGGRQFPSNGKFRYTSVRAPQTQSFCNYFV